jgi:hypothetical protein
MVCGPIISSPPKGLFTSPEKAIISISNAPAGTKNLAIEVTVDKSIITLGSAITSSGVAIAITVEGGIGVISSFGLPSTFTITTTFDPVAIGTSQVILGSILDMIGGAQIIGANATIDVSQVTVSNTSSINSSGDIGGISATSNGTEMTTPPDVKISQDFEGIWKGVIKLNQIPTTRQEKLARLVIFKFCIIGNAIEGTVKRTTFINDGDVISQSVKSNNQITIDAVDEEGNLVTIDLELLDKRSMKAKFDTGETLILRKIRVKNTLCT